MYWALTIFGLGAAAAVGLPLAWDGGYFLFAIIDAGEPVLPHFRLGALPIQLASVLVSRTTHDLPATQVTFAVAYTLVPLIGLVSSWLMVRARSPHLFLWPAMSAGLVTLPGQAFFVSETIMSVHLFWPLLLAIILRPTGRCTALAVALGFMALMMGPSAVPLFMFAAVVALLMGARNPDARRAYGLVAVALVSCAALRSVTFSIDPYDANGMTWDAVSRQVQRVGGIGGYVFWSQVAACVAAVAALRTGQVRDGSNRWAIIAVLAIACAGAFQVLWVATQSQWAAGLEYRTVSVFCALVLMTLAVSQVWFAPLGAVASAALWRSTQRVAVVAACVFATVLTIQSYQWAGLTGELQTIMRNADSPCIEYANTFAPRQSPLDHWSITAYSIVVQGQAPRSTIAKESTCEVFRATRSLQITPTQSRPWNSGWFRLTELVNPVWSHGNDLPHDLGRSGPKEASPDDQPAGYLWPKPKVRPGSPPIDGDL